MQLTVTVLDEKSFKCYMKIEHRTKTSTEIMLANNRHTSPAFKFQHLCATLVYEYCSCLRNATWTSVYVFLERYTVHMHESMKQSFGVGHQFVSANFPVWRWLNSDCAHFRCFVDLSKLS